MADIKKTGNPLGNDEIVRRLCDMDESIRYEFKRVSNKMVHKALETVVAFANTEGGFLVLGMEDFKKATGKDRLLGIQENPEAIDELRQKILHQITPSVEGVTWRTLPCILRDGAVGELVVVIVQKSAKVHSIVADGTWKRLDKGNREMTATEINELSFARGIISAEGELVQIPFELLNTDIWETYCASRKLTSGGIKDRMFRIGLARKEAKEIMPTKAAVLLFADDPSGILACKAAIRIFLYSGTRIEHGPIPNLRKAPKTISGPLVRQITDSYEYVLNEIAKGLTIATSGFETVHRYPTRVIKEALTNAVIHRDYRVNRDIHVRIFDNRIEVESPGLFPANITPATIERAGSFSRNPLIVNHIREFPSPPNIDAGEGVRMMFSTMRAIGLYPPFYASRPHLEHDAVMVTLLNEERPAVWEQASDWIDRHGSITNRDLCQITGMDTLRASRLLKRWVDAEMLVSDMSRGKRGARYLKSIGDFNQQSIFLLSGLHDNKNIDDEYNS
jgi:ATP-dependent DNA helicase RecG